MDRLNLEIDNYSISELKDIFDIEEINDIDAIKKKLQEMQVSITQDLNINDIKKKKIIIFLKNAHDKICGEFSNEINDINKNSSLFTASRTNMINDAPQNHPLILSANRVGGKSAKIYEGRGGDNFPAGYLNPINIRTTNHMMNIDSIFRPNYFLTKSSQFSFDLPDTIKSVVEMSVASIQIPLTLNAINKDNNYFHIQVDDEDPLKVTIHEGNYLTYFTTNDLQIKEINQGSEETSKDLFSKAITNALENTKTASNTSLSSILSFDYNAIKAQCKFKNLSGNKITISFIEEDNEQGMIGQLGWLMGFRKNKYTIDESDDYILSEASISIQQPKYLYLCINDFTNASSNQFVVQFEDSTLAPNIIMRIEYQTFIQDYGIFNYGIHTEVLHGKREYFGPVDIKKLQFTIIDEFGRIVDFNNRDWNVQLEFRRLYE